MAKNIPTVTSPLPRDLQQFVQRVREALDGKGLDSVVTARQLVAAGVAGFSNGSVSPTETPVDAPRPPTALSAQGGLASIILTWGGPGYIGHAYTEIWAGARTEAQEAAGDDPVIGEAELVGMTAGNNFAHNLGSGATRWYWVRNVNRLGVASAFNATDGLEASTSVDPEHLLELLTGEITASQLYSDLSTRIDLIDGADTVAGSVNYRVKEEHDSRVSAQATISSAITSEESSRQTSDSATTSQLNVAVSQYQHNAASIASETQTRATEDSAIASRTDVLGASIGDSFAGIKSEETARASSDESSARQINALQASFGDNSAAIYTEQTARADDDEALTNQFSQLVSQVGTNTAGIQSESTSRADQDSAVASRLDIVSATAGTNAAAVNVEQEARADADSATSAHITTLSSSVGDSFAAIQSESNTRTSGDSSIASQVTTLQSSVGGNTASISTQQSVVDGLEAQYTVKIDNNGYVSGFGLASENVDGDVKSQFMVRADRFSIINPAVAQVTVLSTTTIGSSSYLTAWVNFSSTSDRDQFTVGDTVAFLNHPNDSYAPRTFEVVQVGLNGSTPAVKISSDETIGYISQTATTAAGTKLIKSAVPFIVDSGNVVMDTAYIKDATITEAHLGTLTADVINSGLLNTVDFYGNTIAGTTVYLGGTVNYTTDSNNNNIGISSVSSPKVTMNSTGASFNVDAFKVSNGSSDITPFKVTNGVVYINSAQIEDGTITDAKIVDGTITFAKIEDSLQSTNYVASGGAATPAGWKLDKDGTIDFTDGTITAGTLESTDGKFVIDLDNKSIKIEV